MDWGTVADDAALVLGIAGMFGCGVCLGASLVITGVRIVQKAAAGDGAGALMGVIDIASAGAARLVTRTVAAAGTAFNKGIKFRNLPGATKADKVTARSDFRSQHASTWGLRIGAARHVAITSTVYSMVSAINYGVSRFKQITKRGRY